jgi:hypothetical protein
VLLPEVDAFDHRSLGEEEVDGARCFVVESVLKDALTADELGYLRKKTWIDVSNYLDRRIQYLDASGKVLRVQRSSDPRPLGKGGWLMMRREIRNLGSGRGTTLEYTDVEYSPNLREAIFNAKSLQDAQ